MAGMRLRRLPVRFSLLILLLVFSFICVILGWWRYIYTEDHRIIARRNVLTQKVTDLTREWHRKWEDYLDIARGMQKVEVSNGRVLLQLELKRLDRIETEILRLEGQQLELQQNDKSGRHELLKQRIADLRKQGDALENRIAKSSELSFELVTRRAELDSDQRTIEELSKTLEELDVELKVRGLSM
jgi:TolA-binding protein